MIRLVQIGLSLNAKQTKYVVIRPPGKRLDLTNYNIHIKDTHLTRVGNGCIESSTKFIRVFIDKTLT